MDWLKLTCLASSCLLSQPPAEAPETSAIKAYVSKVDHDKSLLISRYSTTYGHPMKPGKDSIFWAYASDHTHSAVLYYSAGKLVKAKEIIRYGSSFGETSYYFKNNQLLFVKKRDVRCSSMNQRAIWLYNTPVCNSEQDYLFRGSYYFLHDSCVTKQERGTGFSEPIGLDSYKHGTLSKFFPWQAARYVAAFGKIPVGKKPLNFRP